MQSVRTVSMRWYGGSGQGPIGGVSPGCSYRKTQEDVPRIAERDTRKDLETVSLRQAAIRDSPSYSSEG